MSTRIRVIGVRPGGPPDIVFGSYSRLDVRWLPLERDEDLRYWHLHIGNSALLLVGVWLSDRTPETVEVNKCNPRESAGLRPARCRYCSYGVPQFDTSIFGPELDYNDSELQFELLYGERMLALVPDAEATPVTAVVNGRVRFVLDAAGVVIRVEVIDITDDEMRTWRKMQQFPAGPNGSPSTEPHASARPLPPQRSPRVAVRVNPIDGAEAVYVPAGEFTMGADEGSGERARPAHVVRLDGYWVYRNPVTTAQYLRFCEETGRPLPEAPPWGWVDDFPVVNVTWHDAVAYCSWAGVALPTEAQWEKAARGTGGAMYPWGQDWDPRKCASSVGGVRLKRPRAVGAFPGGASPYGALDMVGNVSEWCADWLGPDYSEWSGCPDPVGSPRAVVRSIRGGSWHTDLQPFLSPAVRLCVSPTLPFIQVGFRCVLP